MVKAGEKRHRVTIQERVEDVRNELGEVIESWKDVRTVWAKVQPLRGRELFQAQQVQADVTHTVGFGYFFGLHPKNRCLMRACGCGNDRVLNIAQVINVEERNREYELVCVEVV